MNKNTWFERNALTITFAGGCVATLITLTAYAFTTFETKETVEKRLDRIEQKIDDINAYLLNK